MIDNITRVMDIQNDNNQNSRHARRFKKNQGAMAKVLKPTLKTIADRVDAACTKDEGEYPMKTCPI